MLKDKGLVAFGWLYDLDHIDIRICMQPGYAVNY